MRKVRACPRCRYPVGEGAIRPRYWLEDGTFGFYRRGHATCPHIQDEIMEPVEHLCRRCNSSVDDNSPFCPTCEAAQVIAAPKEYARSPVTVMVENTQPFFNAGTFPKSIGNSDSKAELRGAFYAAIVVIILSLVQPGGILIVTLPLGGFLSVWMYRRFSLGAEASPRTGFRLGAFTGLFVFGLL